MHAYTITGEARHYQPTKTKGAKHDTRPTSLSDIQKQGLFPSVTEYCRMLSAPGLEEYRIQQVVEACFVDTPMAGEDISGYRKRIISKSKEDSSGAADLGTLIHASIEAYLTNQETWKKDELFAMPDGTAVEAWEFVLPVISKINDLGISVSSCESIVVNPEYGYAGTVDLIGSCGPALVVVDFKSKRTKADTKIVPQETHPIQIGAYAAAVLKNDWSLSGLEHSRVEGYNIYISTTEIGRVEHVMYDQDYLTEAWRAFKHLISLWEWRTKYSAAVK